MNNLRSLKIFLLAIPLICLTIVFCEKKSELVKIEYDKSVEPITLKDKVLQSYKIDTRKNLGKDQILQIAKELTDISLKSLNFEKFEKIEENVVALRNDEDPSASFEINTGTGNFLYNSGLNDYRKDGDTPNLVFKEKAAVMALKYLEKLGLNPKKEELDSVNIGGLNMAVLEKDGTTNDYKKLVTVRYGRILNNIPVMGESRIIVQLGKEGSLAGLTFYWGDIAEKKKIKTDELLTDKQIRAQLESRLREAAGDAKRIIVEKAALVLYDDGRGLVEPAYHVQAKLFYEIKNEDDQKDIQRYDTPYDYYVPVLIKPLGFYPYMEVADSQPVDARDIKTTPTDDE